MQRVRDCNLTEGTSQKLRRCCSIITTFELRSSLRAFRGSWCIRRVLLTCMPFKTNELRVIESMWLVTKAWEYFWNKICKAMSLTKPNQDLIRNQTMKPISWAQERKKTWRMITRSYAMSLNQRSSLTGEYQVTNWIFISLSTSLF